MRRVGAVQIDGKAVVLYGLCVLLLLQRTVALRLGVRGLLCSLLCVRGLLRLLPLLPLLCSTMTGISQDLLMCGNWHAPPYVWIAGGCIGGGQLCEQNAMYQNAQSKHRDPMQTCPGAATWGWQCMLGLAELLLLPSRTQAHLHWPSGS